MLRFTGNSHLLESWAYSSSTGRRAFGFPASRLDGEDASQIHFAKWELVRQGLIAILGDVDFHLGLDLFSLGKTCQEHAKDIVRDVGTACRRKQTLATRLVIRLLSFAAGRAPDEPHWQSTLSLVRSCCRNAIYYAVLDGLRHNGRVSLVDARFLRPLVSVEQVEWLPEYGRRFYSCPESQEVWEHFQLHHTRMLSQRSPLLLALSHLPSEGTWTLGCVRRFGKAERRSKESMTRRNRSTAQFRPVPMEALSLTVRERTAP